MSEALETAGVVIILFGSSCLVTLALFVIAKYVADLMTGGGDD